MLLWCLVYRPKTNCSLKTNTDYNWHKPGLLTLEKRAVRGTEMLKNSGTDLLSFGVTFCQTANPMREEISLVSKRNMMGLQRCRKSSHLFPTPFQKKLWNNLLPICKETPHSKIHIKFFFVLPLCFKVLVYWRWGGIAGLKAVFTLKCISWVRG